MTDIGYHEPIPGIYGTANPATDSNPASRAALQEATIQAQIARAEQPGYVPPNYTGPASVGPSWNQTGGPANLPKIGWTCQNGGGSSAFVEEPWTAVDMGHIPIWDTDPNPAAAGAYDMNPVTTGAFAYDRNNRAPIGDGLLQYDDTPTNPNAPTTDVSGSVDLEY